MEVVCLLIVIVFNFLLQSIGQLGEFQNEMRRESQEQFRALEELMLQANKTSISDTEIADLEHERIRRKGPNRVRVIFLT